jgi:hypothetical protein
MTPDDKEYIAAETVAGRAYGLALQNNKANDVEAATIAILIRALEQITPDWSHEARARLFTGDEE